MRKELIPEINKVLDLSVPENISIADLENIIAAVVNYLIDNDFQKLLQMLYRMDVSEDKLKNLLNEAPEKDAGMLIARLVIERQVQKIETREKYKRPDDIPENEQW